MTWTRLKILQRISLNPPGMIGHLEITLCWMLNMTMMFVISLRFDQSIRYSFRFVLIRSNRILERYSMGTLLIISLRKFFLSFSICCRKLTIVRVFLTTIRHLIIRFFASSMVMKWSWYYWPPWLIQIMRKMRTRFKSCSRSGPYGSSLLEISRITMGTISSSR